MTPADVVSQQLLAAWVSAAASVIQAVGSVAAIYASVRIAIRAERRAAASEQASVAREQAAEAAALVRAEAADRRSEERIKAAEAAPRKRVAVLATQLATVGAQKIADALRPFEQRLETDQSEYYGAIVGDVAKDARESLAELLNKVDDADLTLLLRQLIRLLEPTNFATSRSRPLAQLVPLERRRLEQLTLEIEALRSVAS